MMRKPLDLLSLISWGSTRKIIEKNGVRCYGVLQKVRVGVKFRVNDIPGAIFANCLNNRSGDARKDMKLLRLMWVTNPHQGISLQEGL